MHVRALAPQRSMVSYCFVQCYTLNYTQMNHSVYYPVYIYNFGCEWWHSCSSQRRYFLGSVPGTALGNFQV